MSRFEALYGDAFAAVGRALSERDAIAKAELDATEQRLGATLPLSLRAFYRIAGRAIDFTRLYDQFVALDALEVRNGKLVFLVENQAVVLYGVAAGKVAVPDPPVFMCANEAPYEWFEVCPCTSTFIQVMLRWEATYGGAMSHTGTALVTSELPAQLSPSWQPLGEVNEMRAFSQRGRALCHVQWSDGWRVFAGATSEADLQRIQAELGLVWTEPRP